MKGVCTACEKKGRARTIKFIKLPVSPLFLVFWKNNLLTIFIAKVFIPLGVGMRGLALCHNFFVPF